MKFCFGDIVVVENGLIGVIVKCWGVGVSYMDGIMVPIPPHYEVYVRMSGKIVDYPENKIQRYMVRHKYLDEQELEWQDNAIKGI